jgi:tetratricopeptide (TPR) repeat protein
MTIQCRTGCGAFVSYEMEHFADGFIYHMPLNLDKTIHNCQNLPENEEYNELPSHIENSTIWQEYVRYEEEIGVTSYGLELVSSEAEKLEIFKKLLVLQQIKCTLFPSPLMHGHYIFDDYDLSDSKIPEEERDHWWTHLTRLSECYENLGMLDCAITALEIQNKIRLNSANKNLGINSKILKLYYKLKNLESSKDFEITAFDLWRYINNAERTMHQFLRDNLSELTLKNEYEKAYLKAEKNMKKDPGMVKRKFNDIFQFLTLGNCVHIFKDQKWKSKKERKFESVWMKFDYKILEKFHSVNQARVHMFAHNFEEEPLDDIIPKSDKVKNFHYCKDILKYFEDLKYV